MQQFTDLNIDTVTNTFLDGDGQLTIMTTLKSQAGSIGMMVREFHLAMGLPVLAHPMIPGQDRIDFRLALEEEEYRELVDAYKARDIVEVADAIGDLIYVLAGRAIEHGINIDAVLAEIHRSNMTKLGADGKGIRNGVTEGYREGEPGHRPDLPLDKVIKGPNYEKANIAGVMQWP